MAERKALSKRMRFEVFKRDKFTCQYCGRMAPDIVLEVDHIKPVSKGGKNELINLVTSCRDCNSGKTNRELSDTSAVKVQQRQLKELADRKEQLEMMLEWRDQLESLQSDYVSSVEDVIYSRTEIRLNDYGKSLIRKVIKEFGLKEVLDATDIAISAYYNGTRESFDTAAHKISGICANRRKQANDQRYYYANYLKKACRNRFAYSNQDRVEAFVFLNVKDEDSFERAKLCLKTAGHWTGFCDNLEEVFGNRP